MNDKKKIVIIAIILFIFLGLTVFTFANPSDDAENNGSESKDEVKEENKTNEKEDKQDKDEESVNGEANNTQGNNNVPVVNTLNDNSYDVAKEAVINAENKVDEESYNNALELVDKVTNEEQKEELNNRLDEVKNGIDAKALVETLEAKTNSAANIADMEDARDYRTEEQIVTLVTNLTNEDLKSELQSRLNTLSKLLDDNTIEINIEDGAILNSATIEVKDENEVTIVLTKGENSKEIENGTEILDDDGVYTLTVTDVAFNSKTITFTIDTTNPEMVSTKQEYETKEGGRIKITVVFSEAVEYPFDNLNWRQVSETEYYTYFYRTKDYTIKFTDIAGNENTYTLSIDKTAPEVVSTKQEYEAKEGGRIKTTVVFSEAVEYPFDNLNWRQVSETEYYTYFYRTKDYTINFNDLIGNPNSYTLSIDKSAPEMTKLQVYNKNNTSSEYVKNGDIVRVLVTFNEKLETLPTLTIGKHTSTFEEISDGKGGVIYSADITIPEDEKELKEGILAYTISGYKDAAGNEGKKLNETLSQMTLTYDRTPATFTLSEGTIGTNPYSKLNVKIYDANGVASVVINGKQLPHTGKYVDINDGHAYTFIEGENVIVVTDKAGNVSTITYVKDTTAPTLPTKEDTVGTDPRYSKISFKPQDNMLIDYYVINGTKVDLKNNWISDVNYGNIKRYLVEGENTIVLYDAAGNKVEKTFYMDWINPGYNYVGIMNTDQVTEGYAKVGDRIWVYVVIDEYVSEEPIITINGVKAKIVQTEDGAKFNDTWYKYVGEVVMTEEMEEGEIEFTIDGYKDLAGNPNSEVLTNAHINHGLKSIKLDTTAPRLVVKNTSVGTDSIYSKLDMQALDTNLAYITINGTKYSARVDINDGHIQSYVEGKNTVTAVDKAGNVTEKTFTIDRNLTIANNLEELKNAIDSCTNVYLAGNIVLNEKLTIKCDITISGGSITRDVNYTGNLFTVNKDVTLTLNGTVIDGNNNWTLDYESYNDYLKNMKKVTSAETSHKFTTLEVNKPVATTDMFIVNGNLNLSNVTIKNHAGVGGASVITDGNNAAQITMTNTTIEHCTTPNTATVVSLEKGGQWTINEGTVITGNHAGSNGGIVRVNYATGKVTMNGGKVTNNTAVNSNGTFIMMWNQATFEMNGGEVSYNSGVNGWNNGRTAAIYGHSKSHTIINGGSINNNTGISYGGIDAPYASYEDNATVVINGGNIINNVSILSNANKDLHDGFASDSEEKGAITVNGGTFTQDVSKWVSEDKTLVDNGNGTWTVK